jgi:hypothetical protein
VTCLASTATESGYDLRLRCTCAEHDYVFVTPEIATDDFLAQADQN